MSGIAGNILKVIFNLYSNAKSYVKVNNESSSLFPCQVGVRQGDNLSSLFFAIYLNDLGTFLADKVQGLETHYSLQ